MARRRRSRARFKIAKPVVNPLVQSGVKSTRREIAEALKIASANLFFRYGYSCTYELGLESWGARRADVAAVKMSGQVVIIEVKSSVADFRTDNKMREYLKHSDRFYLCFTPKVWAKIKAKEEYLELVPRRAGIITLQQDGYAKIVRPCKVKQMKVERRLNMLARLAWRNGDLSKRTKKARIRVFINE